MKVNGFFPLFLMENRGIKGHFLSPKVGANSPCFFQIGANIFPAVLYRAAASQIPCASAMQSLKNILKPETLFKSEISKI